MRLFFVLFLSFNLSAQIGTEQWRLHVTNKKALDVVAGNGLVYTAFQNGLLEYDIANSETSLWTNVNGLSDVKLSCLGYDKNQNSLYIGYENGNLDRIQNNRVTNIPAIRLANITGNKRINRIVVHDKYIYIATGFSIVKFDPLKFEVRDTYYPTNGLTPIVDIAFRNDSIFALTAQQLYKGSLKNVSLADVSQWKIDTRVPIITSNKYSDIQVVNEQMFVVYKNEDYAKDSIYHVTNTGIKSIFDASKNLEINSIQEVEGKLAINIDAGIYLYSSDLSNYSFLGMSGVSVNNSYSFDDKIWVADNYSGLVRYHNGGIIHINFQGPPKNQYYAVDFNKGKLAIVGGGMTGKGMTWNSSGMYSFENEVWSLTDKSTQTLWKDKNIWDCLAVSINPKDANNVAIGSFSDVPLSIITDGKQISEVFTVDNSPIEKTKWNTEALITDVKYDDEGNLWIANSYSMSPLKAYTKDKKWISFPLGSSVSNTTLISQIAIDYNGNKWLAVPGIGVIAYNDNETISNLSDDKIKIIDAGESSGALPTNQVTALAVDFNNAIWVGTESGFAIIYNSANVFSAAAGTYNAQRIKVNFEGVPENLLGNTYFTDIEVDGGNRKWLATANSGIFLMSKDGSQILQNFTTENSPLISNNIIDMVFDPKTGELYIVTDIGIVSYRTDTSEGDSEYSDVTVFPNPVKPDFSGLITIQGIQYDSDIKVTDASGNLVYKTTSNGGTATWDGKTLAGERVKSGVYLFWTAPNSTDAKGRKVGKVVVIN